ncbi:MAG: hypothetical protein ABI748_06435 [Dokdonella sp.]
MIEESQAVLHEPDQPDLVTDFLDADVVTCEDASLALHLRGVFWSFVDRENV